MPENFDPYYLWLAIPPSEQPANHYRLLGVPLFEENPGVIESAADRQMAHLRSVQAGKHSALSQRLLNEVAAAKVCLLRAPQKSRYDQALRLKLQPAAVDAPASPAVPQELPRAAAQAMPTAPQANVAAPGSEGFWDDVTGAGNSKAAATVSKPKPAAAPKRKMQLWPIALAAGACLLVAVVVIIKSSSGNSDEPSSTSGAPTVPAIVAKPKESVLVFEWPADDRAGLTLSVDGAKVVGPPTGPWEFHCSPGPHRVVASRTGFKPIDLMVDAPADGKRKITDAWTPLATLALAWPIEDRDGAVLNVDGQTLPVGSDQPLVLPVEPGTHTVRVTRLGYELFEKNITVALNSQQEFPIALRATPATLVVRWPAKDRAGAELRIDGQVRPLGSGNVASIAIAMKPGTHEVFIFRPGFRPFTQSISLAAADRKSISPTWSALPSLPPATVANTDSATGPKISDTGNVATAPPTKHPIPTAADQQRVSKQLDEIYKPSHDAAKDLAQSKELADLAVKAEDVTERYMLFLKAADFAVEGGDLSSALQAIDSLDAEFTIASIDAKERILEKFVKGPSNPDQITDAVNTATRLIDDAIAADRYDTAVASISLASKFLVKKGVDADFRRDSEKQLGTYRAKIKAIQPLWEAAQAAKKTLETKPDDADANTTLGRWYCFYKGDWAHGLPYCVKSGNDRLKPVAELELKPPADANQKVAVADQWWDIGQKETGTAADSIHLHAGDLYRSAMPDLNSVLKKAAVEKRLTEVTELRSRIGDAAGGQHTGPVIFQRGRWVDVLKLIDVNRDHASGNWTRHGGEITGEPGVANNPRINLPIAMDGGYDLEVDFTRATGAGEIHTIFTIGKQICGFTLNAGTYNGFDSINGRTLYDYFQNPYVLTGFRLQNGHRYQQIISVRLGKGGVASVDVALDGKQFLPHLEGDPALLSVDTRYLRAPTQPTIDLGYGSSVTINAIRLRMVSGQGHSEIPGADASDPSSDSDSSTSKKPTVSPLKPKVPPK